MTIGELAATGSAPTLGDWRARYVAWSVRERAGGQPHDQFNSAFPDPFRSAIQLKLKSNGYKQVCGFLSYWVLALRSGAKEISAIVPNTEAIANLQAFAERLRINPAADDLISDVGPRDVEAFINTVCGAFWDLAHPEFPFCRAYAPVAVKTALYGVAAGSPVIFGSYGIVREARGWLPHADRPADRGRLVRDVMFVRPEDSKDPEHATVRADYYSSLDGQVYTLQRSLWGDKVSWFEGSGENTGGTAMHVVSSSLDRTLKHPHLALLCGSTRAAGRPAAWKALVSRQGGPNPDRLERALRLTLDSDVNKVDVLRFLQSEAALGDLGNMSRSARGSDASETFRRYAVLMPQDEVRRALNEICTASVQKAIKESLATHREDPDDRIIAALTTAALDAVSGNWPWLEAAQMILTLPTEFRDAHEVGSTLPPDLIALFRDPAEVNPR